MFCIMAEVDIFARVGAYLIYIVLYKTQAHIPTD